MAGSSRDTQGRHKIMSVLDLCGTHYNRLLTLQQACSAARHYLARRGARHFRHFRPFRRDASPVL